MDGDAALLLLADSRLPAGGHAHSGGVEEAVRRGTVTGTGDLARFLRGRLATAGLVTAALAAAGCELAASETAAETAPGGVPGTAADSGGADRELGATRDPGAPPADDAAHRVLLWRRLDAEADARTASPAQREAARTQGRLLLRTARRMWPSAALDTLARAVPEGPHHPVALGAAAASAGCAPRQAALAAAYTSVTGPATAAVRLLGLDPVTVHRLLADLAPALDDAARAACASLDDAVPADEEPDDCRAEEHPGQQPGRPPGRQPGGHAAWQARWRALPGHSAPALDLLAEGHLTNPMKLFVS
ncbi:urease accessory protein UreF [Microbispora sp. NEAU-D428]|uniref:urease accessory protein UreF n=1 Tax=Microbispora sitophila TaxID=2771537 RepID=UPI0018675E88|nr:urease accessory UreF family protein [Microbispora sitophila]MBE3010040.1 urease accessory protein UreF [Microbispora sitophila]